MIETKISINNAKLKEDFSCLSKIILQHEQALIRGDYRIKQLYDWEAFKGIVLGLEEKYSTLLSEMENPSEIVANFKYIKKYIESIAFIIKSIESKYNILSFCFDIGIDFKNKKGFKINKNFSPLVMEHIRMICIYNNIESAMQELEEISMQNIENAKVCKIKDYLGFEYQINQKDCASFIKLRKEQTKIYNDFYSSLDFVTKPNLKYGIDKFENYKSVILNQEEQLIAGTLPIKTMDDWDRFVKDIFLLEISTKDIIKNYPELKNIYSFDIKRIQQYINTLLNMIREVINNPKGLSENDLPTIMMHIQTICTYNNIQILIEELQENSKSKETLKLYLDDGMGSEYLIAEDFEQRFEYLFALKCEQYENYKDAIDYIFASNQNQTHNNEKDLIKVHKFFSA